MSAIDWRSVWAMTLDHPLFSVALTLIAFQLALALYRRSGWLVLQPVMIGMLLVVGTVNAVERLAGVELPNEMREGLLKVRVPDRLDESAIGQIQLLLESMVVMLESIQDAYGPYIALQQTKR